jgi:hypothetical protein
MANQNALIDENTRASLTAESPTGEIIRAKANALGSLYVDTTAPTSASKTLVDEQSTALTYVGKAAQGSATSAAVWQVFRVTVAGTITTIEYAGTGLFDQIWDDRATLTYS